LHLQTAIPPPRIAPGLKTEPTEFHPLQSKENWNTQQRDDRNTDRTSATILQQSGYSTEPRNVKNTVVRHQDWAA